MANNSKITSTLIIDESSARLSADQYARRPAGPARPSRRQVAILGGMLLAFLLPAFVSLGLWQWRKAEAKTTLQAELDVRSSDAPVIMPNAPVASESLRYRRVILRGTYDAARQVLIDNRLHREQAGYHVITPLRLEGSTMHVLVNRGWLPAAADHRILPTAEVPAASIELTGIAVVPAQRFFNLAAQPTSGWEPVWQNLDLARFREVLPYPLQPVVIQLDPAAPGGYLREWPRPDERADRHRNYALQWFGFAVSSLGIWVLLAVAPAMTTTAIQPSLPPRNGSLMLALVVCLLALPFVIAGGLYLFGWQPARTANHGHLLNPPVPLPASGLRALDGQALATADLSGKWLLLLSGSGPCDADCTARIDEMRRIQVALNKDMSRLRRVVLSDQPGDAELTAARHRQPDLLVATAPPNWLPGATGDTGFRLHIIDPQGLLVMEYPPDVAAKGVRADLERLLKFAWNG